VIMRRMVERTLYRYGWDTRCRNLAPARVLRPVLTAAPNGRPAVLDVGCSGLGVATFLRGVPAVGLDRQECGAVAPGLVFHRGDVTALPYLDQSFPVVSCIDVLEHLPHDARDRAIKEMVRVASGAVLIACPHGQTAKDCDEEFRLASESHGRAFPSWVVEHQRQSYPVVSQVVEGLERAAAESGRSVKVSLSYCEPASICRFIRAMHVRSRALYVVANLVLGALFSMLPPPGADDSYRMIALAELKAEAEAAR
jgi:hypothetical protein